MKNNYKLFNNKIFKKKKKNIKIATSTTIYNINLYSEI